MLKPALHISAVLAALLFPSLAPAQSYELLHEGAGEQTRAVCFGEAATVSYLEALHFQMEVLGRSYDDATKAVRPRMARESDIECYYVTSTAEFEQSARVIDVVERSGLAPWSYMAMYGVSCIQVTASDGRYLDRQMVGKVVYVVISDYFVRKRP